MPNFHVSVQKSGSDSYTEFDLLHTPDKKSKGETVLFSGIKYTLVCKQTDLSFIHALLQTANSEGISSPANLGQIAKDLTRTRSITCEATLNVSIIKSKSKILKSSISSIINIVIKALNFLFKAFEARSGIYFTAKWYQESSTPPTAELLMAQGHIRQALDKFESRLLKDPRDLSARHALAELGFSPGEWSSLKKQRHVLHDPFYHSRARFSPLELHALEIISKIEKFNHSSSAHEKTILRQFFAFISGNRDFNKRISHLMRSQPDVQYYQQWKFGSNTLNYLREYSYKSNKMHELFAIAPKFKQVGEMVEQGREKEVQEKEKLTRSNFRQADSFSNMSGLVDWMDKFQLWAPGSLMGKLKPAIDAIQYGMKKIDERFSAEHLYLTGDILLDTLKESLAYDSKPFNIANKIDWMLKLQGAIFKQKYVHAALGLARQHGYAMAEIDARYQDPSVSFSRLCIAKTYRLQMKRLLTARGLSHCRRLFRHHPELKQFDTDDKVIRYLESQFQEILQDFFSDADRFGKISNDQKRQILTVVKHHCQKKGIKPEELDFESEQHMICSEFVGKAIVYSLNKLDKKLKAELEEALLYKYPHVNTETKGGFLTDGLLKIPISEFENFSAMHVDRLFFLLSKYTEEIPPPAFIGHVLQSS